MDFGQRREKGGSMTTMDQRSEHAPTPESMESSVSFHGHPGTEVTRDAGTAANGTASDAFARRLLESLVRFRDGDFGSRMPADLVGLDGKIADVFNDILTVSSRRAAETARVCRV